MSEFLQLATGSNAEQSSQQVPGESPMYDLLLISVRLLITPSLDSS